MTGTGDPTPLYPLGLRLAGRRAVVVGGGPVALRRVSGLLAAGAEVLVVAPRLVPTLDDLTSHGVVRAFRRPYDSGDLDGAWLAFACTGDPEVDAQVARDAQERRVWCVRADDAEASSAWVPAVGRAGRLTVSVHADADPRRAIAARDLAVAALAGHAPPPARRPSAGRVVLVGGGPGDPGLITVRGLDRLREADVVVVDRLAPLPLLDDLPPHVEVVDAAKQARGRAMRQEEIQRLLVEHARAGRTVVRLKGGDPFVFGRGMEEVQACLDAGIPVEVVPGVTSAVAAPALAGIPVTSRGLSQGFAVVSGHVPPADPRSTVDWKALAASGTTLVLLMAVDFLPEITQELLQAGMAPDTPAAAVQDAGHPGQRVVRAPLEALSETVRNAAIRAPAVVVIGSVVGAGPTYLEPSS